MMLSDVDLREALAAGRIAVAPFSDRQLRAAGITLHLGENLQKPLPGAVVDVKTGSLPKYEAIKMDANGYLLDSQEFLLGHTLERITVGPTVGLMIEGRSTLARVGLTIVKTAMLVEPGHHDRTITLEIANHGPNPIRLYPEMKIARAVVHDLRTPSSRPYDSSGGKYREQFESVGLPILENEFRTP